MDPLLPVPDGSPVLFGELYVTTGLAAGGGYELRHRADAGQPAETLTCHDDPEAAAGLSLHDDAGSYRPLKTAPNLRRGWRLVVADAAGLRLALEGFYPGRGGAWRLFQQRRLETTPLRETLNRQTGMYRVTGKLTEEQADALVGRFCRSDGGCLRTILWRRNAAGDVPATPLPPEKFDPAHDQTGRGEAGVVPLLCQEACNLLVAEAGRAVRGAVPARPPGRPRPRPGRAGKGATCPPAPLRLTAPAVGTPRPGAVAGR